MSCNDSSRHPTQWRKVLLFNQHQISNVYVTLLVNPLGSLLNLMQIFFTPFACWTNCQRESWLVGVEVKSGYGRATKGSSIRKCPGFSMLNSLGSGDKLHKGRVFKIAFTLVKKVLNSSKVRIWFPRLRFRWYLVYLMPLSHNPPSEALQVNWNASWRQE